MRTYGLQVQVEALVDIGVMLGVMEYLLLVETLIFHRLPDHGGL